MERLEDEATDIVQMNAARLLNMCQEKVRNFIRSITRHKRTAATHVLVTMISPSERNVKPYALPVSCIPYHWFSRGKSAQNYQYGSERDVQAWDESLRCVSILPIHVFDVFF